ncbi:hypothetical protein B0H14DRAFT_1046148 [Mycena olivaceomarginata]|nr:hypothetical protein B0H14DRAFT_1046148 [Mycena olivaceomarginata]
MVLYFSFNSPTLRVYDGSCYHLCPRLKMVSTFQVKRRRLDHLNAVLCRLVAYHFFPICLGFRFARLFDLRRRKINVFFHVFSVVGQVGLKRNSRKPESHRLQVPTALTYCDTILCFQSEGSCRELDPSLIFANFLGRSSINSTIADRNFFPLVAIFAGRLGTA